MSVMVKMVVESGISAPIPFLFKVTQEIDFVITYETMLKVAWTLLPPFPRYPSSPPCLCFLKGEGQVNTKKPSVLHVRWCGQVKEQLWPSSGCDYSCDWICTVLLQFRLCFYFSVKTETDYLWPQAGQNWWLSEMSMVWTEGVYVRPQISQNRLHELWLVVQKKFMRG